MTLSISIEQLRRDAKALKKAFQSGDAPALARVDDVLPGLTELKHADALHVVAREAGYDSWPKLKFVVETHALDKSARLERLKMALFHGQGWRVSQLLAETPDLRRDNLGIMCALYDLEGVRAALARNPEVVSKPVLGPRVPILHLAFSRWW